MKAFFDEEFTGLRQKTTLVSLGIVMENGEEFYAELTDYDKNQVDDFCKKHVIANLIHNKNTLQNNKFVFVNGDKARVRKELLKFLSKFHEDIEFVADVCQYDFVLLQNLLIGDDDKDVFAIPAYISPYCHDINQDIANYKGIKDIEAFDVNREDFAGIEDINGMKHNALWDARVAKRIYEKCNAKTKK